MVVAQNVLRSMLIFFVSNRNMYSRMFSVQQHKEGTKVSPAITEGVLMLYLPKSEAVKPRTIKMSAL
jgi:hypothetical protein